MEAEDRHHGHIRPGCQLTDAVDLQEAIRGDLKLLVQDLLHLRQHRGTAAHGEERKQAKGQGEVNEYG